MHTFALCFAMRFELAPGLIPPVRGHVADVLEELPRRQAVPQPPQRLLQTLAAERLVMEGLKRDFLHSQGGEQPALPTEQAHSFVCPSCYLKCQGVGRETSFLMKCIISPLYYKANADGIKPTPNLEGERRVRDGAIDVIYK